MSSLLPQFEKERKFNLKVLNCHPENVYQTLVKNKALYHKTCYSKYNQRMLNRLIEKKDDVNMSISDRDIISPKRSNGNETYDIMTLVCIFCKHSDNAENLCAAGTSHATTKKVKLDHVTILTEKLKSMAVEVGNGDVLSKLSSWDVASNEIYYHKICYINFRTQYRDTVQKKPNDANEQIKEKESLIKTMRFSQVVDHIYDQKRYESVSSFEVAELEKAYLNLLKNDNIEQTSHVSRFCESLLESIPEVEKRTIKKNFIYFFMTILVMLSLKNTLNLMTISN